MRVDWYIDISEHMKTKKMADQVIKTVNPLMDYFCERLSDQIMTIENIEKTFSEIIEEMPVMNHRIVEVNGEREFVIDYNRCVRIKLTDSTKQIYREIKLTKILA